MAMRGLSWRVSGSPHTEPRNKNQKKIVTPRIISFESMLPVPKSSASVNARGGSKQQEQHQGQKYQVEDQNEEKCTSLNPKSNNFEGGIEAAEVQDRNEEKGVRNGEYFVQKPTPAQLPMQCSEQV